MLAVPDRLPLPNSACTRFRTCHAASVSLATRASIVLIAACALWAFSFPIMKGMAQLGGQAVPGGSSVFFATSCQALRFTVAALALAPALWLAGSLRGITRLELLQGGGIGLFGGVALVLQMDALAYTLASTSAFLTQGYVVLIPLWVGLTHRRLPGISVVGACVLSVVGAALLGWQSGPGGGIRFGRGEWETLAGSVLFAAQILWLERPIFAGNHSLRVTLIMFVVVAMVTWPWAWWSSPAGGWQSIGDAYRSPVALGLLLFLAVPCTLATFPFSNHWQPKVSATQAGLLYCTEPVFTTLVALWVPGIISSVALVDYPNETLTWNRLAGGGLIIGANLWLLWRPPPKNLAEDAYSSGE